MAEVSVLTYGATGDGTTDDTTAINNALAGIASTDVLLFPAGTYLITASITVTRSLKFTGGATLKKSATFAASQALLISTAGLTITDLTLDGNRTNGAAGHGIDFRATSGTITGAYVKRCKGAGILVNSVSAVLRCVNSKSHENDGGGGFGANGDGFIVLSGRGTFINCAATENNRYGFVTATTATTGSVFDNCLSIRNAHGFSFQSNNGRATRLVSEKDNRFGVTVGKDGGSIACTGWVIDSIHARLTGDAYTRADGVVVSQNTTATALELYGCDNCTIDTVVAIKPWGYAVAVATNGAVGCTNNLFRSIVADDCGDPAILLSGGSSGNRFERVYVRESTFALSVGEVAYGAADDNVFDDFVAEGCTYGVLRIDPGSRNRFKHLTMWDCYNLDAVNNADALMWFNAATGTTNYNIVHNYYSRTFVNPAPAGIFNQENGATNNSSTINSSWQ